MRLGLFMMPVHPPDRPMHETLAEDVEKSLLADRLGFDEMFLGRGDVAEILRQAQRAANAAAHR